MKNQNNHTRHFDSGLDVKEMLPRQFSVCFIETENKGQRQVQVLLDGTQIGDIINDNSYDNDFYRFHDIFHYAFAALLGWSPCMRSMLKRKRKSDPLIDQIEDGARAAITEEAISLIIFNEAKRKGFFAGEQKVSKTTLRIVKEMTEPFEVRIRTAKEWEAAILKGYELFRLLISNNGGTVKFDIGENKVDYFPIAC